MYGHSDVSLTKYFNIMSVHSTESKGYRHFFEWLIYAIFVVPYAQIKIFDLPYQLYTFDVFHKKEVNRWSHFIGIPLNLIALYCIFIPTYKYLSMSILILVFGHHLIMTLKYKLYGMIPVIVICHLALWGLAVYIFEPYLFDNTIWYLSPVFHFVFWPFVQYITHSIEPYIPRPWSVHGNWSKLANIIKEREWYITAAIILMMPFNTFVELISSWRNLYIEMLQFAYKAGYQNPTLDAMTQWIEQEVNSDDPMYDYDTFEAAFTPYFEQQMNDKG